MVNPAMMQPGAMEFGPDGSCEAVDPNFFPPPPFGDPAFVPPSEGMPGFEAFSSLAIFSKWIHNNVAWAFIMSLVLVRIIQLKDLKIL